MVFTFNQMKILDLIVLYSLVLIYCNQMIWKNSNSNFIIYNFKLNYSNLYFILMCCLETYLYFAFYYFELEESYKQKIYSLLTILTLVNLNDFIIILFYTTTNIIRDNLKKINNYKGQDNGSDDEQDNGSDDEQDNGSDDEQDNGSDDEQDNGQDDYKKKIKTLESDSNKLINKNQNNLSPISTTSSNSELNFISDKKLSEECVNVIRMILSDVDERTIRLLVRKINNHL